MLNDRTNDTVFKTHSGKLLLSLTNPLSPSLVRAEDCQERC